MNVSRLYTLRPAPFLDRTALPFHSAYTRLSSTNTHPRPPIYKRSGRKAPPLKEAVVPTGPPPVLKYPESLINPPTETLPPPLDLPTYTRDVGTVKYYFRLAKAYAAFYRTGLKNVVAAKGILTGRKEEAWLPRARVVRKDFYNSGDVPTYLCRAEWILMRRVTHDLVRIPIFGLILLVCGELTPVIALWIQGVMPYTCRLPNQLLKAENRIEERRVNSFAEIAPLLPNGLVGNELIPESAWWAARRHVLRSLGLVPRLVDSGLGGLLTGVWWEIRGPAMIRYLAVDDGLLRRDWGTKEELSDDEVKMACLDRGINVKEMPVLVQKGWLNKWLELTDVVGPTEKRGEEAYQRVAVLLTLRPEKWGKLEKGFALPEDVL